jgi:hypothetical protein
VSLVSLASLVLGIPGILCGLGIPGVPVILERPLYPLRSLCPRRSCLPIVPCEVDALGSPDNPVTLISLAS